MVGVGRPPYALQQLQRGVFDAAGLTGVHGACQDGLDGEEAAGRLGVCGGRNEEWLHRKWAWRPSRSTDQAVRRLRAISKNKGVDCRRFGLDFVEKRAMEKK
jgi:hypothetical protein